MHSAPADRLRAARETLEAQTAVEGQRFHKRYEFELELSANSSHQFFTGFTENISAGGLFIATYQTLPLGSKFQIQFTVPGVDYQFQVDCEVRWVREYNEMMPHMTPGMGVNFIDLSVGEQQILNDSLKRMETMFYDDEDDDLGFF